MFAMSFKVSSKLSVQLVHGQNTPSGQKQHDILSHKFLSTKSSTITLTFLTASCSSLFKVILISLLIFIFNTSHNSIMYSLRILIVTVCGLRLPQSKRSFRTNCPIPSSIHLFRLRSSYRMVLYFDNFIVKS